MNRKSGFTLVELMSVIAILAILVIIGLPSIMNIFNKSKKETFLNEVRNLLNASEQLYVNESMKDNWIDDIGSSDSFKTLLNNQNRVYKTLKMDGENEFEFYAQLDEDGYISRFVAMNDEFSIFSVNGRGTLSVDEITIKNASVEDYINDFNISAPTILSKDAYSRQDLKFDFNAKDLRKEAEMGASYTTWTSNDGSVTGTLYSVNKNTGALSEVLGKFEGNSIVFQGWQGFRFNASFDFDNINDSEGYGSFTLESTVNLNAFNTKVSNPFVNLISNIEAGGYYLNIYHIDSHNPKYGYPGISVYLNGGYKHCVSKTPIELGKDYVITGSFNKVGNISKVYINGEQVKVGGVSQSDEEWSCDYNDSWVLKYPAPDKQGRKVPLSVGGNPSHTGFTNVEWVYGKVYTARIYQGVLDSYQIKSNYYSNMVLVNDYDENSQIITLQGGDSIENIAYFEYSFDNGKTWLKYDPDNQPILYENGWVYARTVSTKGVISPYSKEEIYLY